MPIAAGCCLSMAESLRLAGWRQCGSPRRPQLAHRVAAPREDGAEIRCEIDRKARLEFGPCLGVRRPYRRHYRNTGFNSPYKSQAEATAFCFGLAEPVQDQKLDIRVECLVEERSEFSESTGIEPASLCLRSKVLGNPDTTLRFEVNEGHRRASACGAT